MILTGNHPERCWSKVNAEEMYGGETTITTFGDANAWATSPSGKNTTGAVVRAADAKASKGSYRSEFYQSGLHAGKL